VITSVMEHPFRYYFMTPLYTKNLTGSYFAPGTRSSFVILSSGFSVLAQRRYDASSTHSLLG
ncbi:hypothetical protein RY831_29495, partial [Noviherbaspirillum sp. CPCC 100848]